MCGISGVISTNHNKLCDLVKMNDIISHRGPDDEGFLVFNSITEAPLVLGGKTTPRETYSSALPYKPTADINDYINHNAKIAFGHRRLSILDLSPAGHQPMSYHNGRFWIVLNGEIYNYIEIRQELSLRGHQFVSNSDTEVVIAAYAEWGIECQNKFNGMWAFAIYDRVEKKLFLSRDRYGIKPLYYWFSPAGDFYFGSEIKQFSVLPGWKAVLNGPRAIDYLYFSLTDHTEETMFSGVYMILPGHFFLASIDDIMKKSDSGKLDLKRWYFPTEFLFQGGFEDAKVEFLSRFKDSIKLHLRADVHVGSALSGGLDSSSIVSYINILLKEQGKAELQKTFSSCAEDERFDERKWMEEVVKETQVDAHFVYPNGADVFQLTEKLIWHMDEPYQSQSAFLGYHVFQEAKKNNVLVLLNGQGADEYLSGYSAFSLYRQIIQFKQLKFRKLLNEVHGFKGLLSLSKHVLMDSIPLSLWTFLALRNSRQKLYDQIFGWKKLVDKKVHPYKVNNYSISTHRSISNYQLFKDPLQRYLRWEDRNSMANSVEARVPFLDYRLVEFAQSLPIDFLDGNMESKKILVNAMKGILPEKVRLRKDKKGFITPEELWFKEQYKSEFLDMFDNYVSNSKGIINIEKAREFLLKVQEGRIRFDYTYWRIILFCVWMKVFNVELK